MDEYLCAAVGQNHRYLDSLLRCEAAKQWSIYWATAANARVGVPTIGGFKETASEKVTFDQEYFNGKSILVRYTWSKIAPASCQWEQAFSDDFGKTWETNWIMENTRA